MASTDYISQNSHAPTHLERDLCKDFLLQYSLYFSGQERVSGQHQIAQFIKLLTEKVLAWHS